MLTAHQAQTTPTTERGSTRPPVKVPALMSILGKPPLPNAGQISPLTVAVRPPVKLPARECVRARALKKAGESTAEIAVQLDVEEDAVLQALAPMRMPNSAASRCSLNVTVATADFVKYQRLPNEPIWETTGRLFMELVTLRTEAFVSQAMKR